MVASSLRTRKKVGETIISVDGHTRIFSSLNVPLDNKDYLYLIETLKNHEDINITRNVSQNVILKKPRIAVDTHVFRVSNRIGLVNENNVSLSES